MAPQFDSLTLVFMTAALMAASFLVISTLIGHVHVAAHVVHLGHGGHAASHAGAHATVGAQGAPVSQPVGAAQPLAATGATAFGAPAPGAAPAHMGPLVHAAHPVHGASGASGGAHAHSVHHLASRAAGYASSASPAAFAASVGSAIGSLIVGALSMYAFAIGLLVFGVVGFVFHASLRHHDGVAIVAASVGGLGSMIVVGWLLERLFTTHPDSVLTDSSRPEGTLATVSARIRPGALGEVIYTRRGGSRIGVFARNEDGVELSVGAPVVIVAYREGVALVRRWSDVVADVDIDIDVPETDPPVE